MGSNIPKATIFSDYLSVINNIINAHNTNEINIQVQNLLQYGRAKGNTVQLCWILGHSGIIEMRWLIRQQKMQLRTP